MSVKGSLVRNTFHVIIEAATQAEAEEAAEQHRREGEEWEWVQLQVGRDGGVWWAWGQMSK